VLDAEGEKHVGNQAVKFSIYMNFKIISALENISYEYDASLQNKMEHAGKR
jgi:hypothetical protein